MVDIVLPVYNGERFLREQLDSVFHQDNEEWKLYIRDDGSTDDTNAVLEDYAAKRPDRITVIQDNKGSLGVTANVLEILKYTENEFIFFCDQDDVWCVGKIRMMLARMKKLIKRWPDQPILLHTDSLVTDESLRILDRSFTHHAGMYRRRSHLTNVMRRSVVQAATMMINRPLLKYAEALYEEKEKGIMYHDWWFSLIASAFGRIVYMKTPLVYYRQHGGNLSGAGQGRKRGGDILYPSLQYRYEKGLVNDRKRITLFLKNFTPCLSNYQIQLLKYLRDDPNSWKKFMRFRMWRHYPGIYFLYFYLYGVVSR